MLIRIWSIFLLAMLTLWAAAPIRAGEVTLIDGVPHVRNGDPARSEVVELKELWRAGGEDDEVLFGVINEVVADAEGTFYFLDRQLSQVHAYSSQGAFLRTVVTEGDGPGEVRMPVAMVMLPEGRLGVAQAFPAKIVVVDREGTPAGSITPGGDARSGGFNMVQEIASRGQYLAVSGRQMRQSDNGFERIRYLATIEQNGQEKTRLLEDTGPDMVVQGKFVEKDEYFVDHGRWAMGPDGKLYTAETRDEYRIKVYTHGGEQLRVIEREFEPPKRTEEEKGRVGEGMLIMVNGERVQIDAEPEDYPPCIERMYVAESGSLWVRNSRGTRDQAAGIMETWDVFDAEGHFTRQVSFACEGDADQDRLTFTDDDRVFLLKGIKGAVRNQIGNGDADEEVSVMEVICYEI